MKYHRASHRDSTVEIDSRWFEEESGAYPTEFVININAQRVALTVSVDTALAIRDALELALAGTRYANKPGAT